jgi:repressor LexA
VKTLTDRQLEVLRWIADYIRERHFPPTLREIGEGIGVTSSNGVTDILKALRVKGAITWERGCARTIRVLVDPEGP